MTCLLLAGLSVPCKMRTSSVVVPSSSFLFLAFLGVVDAIQ
jgi:hypothetical protein